VLDGAPEGVLSHRELIAATGLSKNTVTKWTRAAAGGGLASSSRQGVRLLPRGALALAGQATTPVGPVALGAAIARWPTVEQQAFLNLGLAEVVARRLFGEQRPGDLLGLIAIGSDSGTGKTLAGLFIARTVGLADELALCRLPARTPGEILGRLEQLPGGDKRFVPAGRLAQPLLILDEFDKADAERRRAALACLDNDYRFEREGELHEQHAVAMLTANKDIRLPDYIARRAIVLDTDALMARGELAAIAKLAGELAELHRQGAFPTIDLDALQPPALTLDDASREVLSDLLDRALTAERRRVTNQGAVELLALAYSALTPGAEPRAMALKAVTDYLLVTDTTAGTRPGWAAGHGSALQVLGPAAGQLADTHAALQRREHQDGEMRGARERQELERDAAHDELVELRGAFTQSLKETSDRLHLGRLRNAAPAERAKAKGLADRLGRLRVEAAETRSAGALHTVVQRSRAPRTEAEALLERVSARRDRKAQLAQRLKAARGLGTVAKVYSAEAEGIRASLDALSTRLRDTHGPELDELELDIDRALATARELPARIADERQQRERHAASRGQAERQQRERHAASRGQAERQQREAATVQLGHVRSQLAELAALARRHADRRPLDVLRETIVAGHPLIAYEATGRRAANLIEQLRDRATGSEGWWYSSHDPSVRFYGTTYACTALSDWPAAGVQRVLAVARSALQRSEVQLAAQAASNPKRPRRRAQAKPRARKPAKPRRQSTSRPKTKRATARAQPAAAPGARVRCPVCETTYVAPGGRFARWQTCPRCNVLLQPA